MRSAITLLLALAAVNCGPPDVDTPAGNDKSTSDEPVTTETPPPSVSAVPRSYPYSRLALRGNAPDGIRVIVKGAGNPRVGPVQPQNGDFCIVVDLTTVPASYQLTIESQGGDGKLSRPVTVEVDRTKDAPPPTDAKLCDGSPAAD